MHCFTHPTGLKCEVIILQYLQISCKFFTSLLIYPYKCNSSFFLQTLDPILVTRLRKWNHNFEVYLKWKKDLYYLFLIRSEIISDFPLSACMWLPSQPRRVANLTKVRKMMSLQKVAKLLSSGCLWQGQVIDHL